jgi:hypothetical protein
LVAATEGLVAEIEAAVAEELADHVGIHGPTLVPGADHVTGHGAGSTCHDEECAYEAVQHVSPCWMKSEERRDYLNEARQFVAGRAPFVQLIHGLRS